MYIFYELVAAVGKFGIESIVISFDFFVDCFDMEVVADSKIRNKTTSVSDLAERDISKSLNFVSIRLFSCTPKSHSVSSYRFLEVICKLRISSFVFERVFCFVFEIIYYRSIRGACIKPFSILLFIPGDYFVKTEF